MPIFTNIAGAIRLLTCVAANVGGVMREFDTVHANVGGVLREIHSSLPRSLTWHTDTSKDSAAKINSVSADGMTVKYTGSNPAWTTTCDAIYSDAFSLPAGAKISFAFSGASGNGTKYYGLFAEKDGVIVNGVQNTVGGETGTFNVSEAGLYRLVLRAHGVIGNQSGVNYYSCTVTVKITITR